jgi:cyclophilin family peptidyl-prolyl cis-trans isomerase
MRLIKLMTLVACVFTATLTYAAKPQNYYVRLKTPYGESIIRLYNETPKHRDNFIKLVKDGFYNGTLFHRVIAEFMIQGGDPESKNASPDKMLGTGGLPYKIQAEFHPSLFHKRGVLAAARDENREKASSATQFYIVQGRTFKDDELNRLEQFQGRKIPLTQREAYKTIGGTPHLDLSYTVFGEIVKGFEQVNAIAALPTNSVSRPLKDVAMQIRLLKKREIKKLEKELVEKSFKDKLIMNGK